MKNILLIGLGRFGLHIAKELHELRHEVLAVDILEERVNDALPYVTSAQIGDSTSLPFLQSLGIDSFDLCIVAISGNFQASLEVTDNLKTLGAKYVIARAEQEAQERFLRRNGADEVIFPERQLAKWIAVRYGEDQILDYFSLDNEHSVMEVVIPKQWLGLTVGQLDIRRKYGINIMAFKKNGRFNASVTPDTELTEDKTLLVLGEYKQLKKCFKI